MNGGVVARAMAVAAARLGVGGDALERLGGREGGDARALAGGMGGDTLAAAVRELAAPRPAGWKLIHESWVEGPPRGDAGAPAVQRHLWRIAYRDRVPMPSAGTASVAGGAVALVALEPGALTRALALLGRRQLAHALAGSAPRSIADLAARLPWGRELLGDVTSIAALGDAAEKRLGRRALAQVRSAGLTWSDPLALPRAGARFIAPAVAAVADLAPQLAQRLPRPVGSVVLDELRAFAVEPGTDRGGAGDAEIAAAIARVTVAAR